MPTDSKRFPQKFGRYFLLNKIAKGGMAEIFRAKSVGAEGFAKTIVIKRILPHFTEEEGFVTMFQDEAKVASHLNHANVVQIFDFNKVDELFYIAMEYVEGQDLKRVLDVGARKGKPLSIAQAVHVVIEAGQGLDYAHKREVDGSPLSIIHRDVSPHNVMVSYNGETKIMDFGIAKATSRSTKTRVGTVKGKCAYMSPEQARGKPLDPRSDLFALGVVLWEMLSGKRLFVGESDYETLNNVLRADVPSLRELNPDVPEELDRIVLKSLSKDRDERHGDIGAFIAELRRWFYAEVPDPSAISLRDYMHELFDEEIEQLKQDIVAEAEALEEVRTGSHDAAGGGRTASVVAAADEHTVALDAQGNPIGANDETAAIDTGSHPSLGGPPGPPPSGPPGTMGRTGSSPTGSNSAVHAQQGVSQIIVEKRTPVGLIVGLVLVVVALAGVAVFFATKGADKPTEPAPAAPAVSAEPEAPKVKVIIDAPGAAEIQIDDQTEATSGHLEFQAEQGRELKIVAITKDGQKKLVRHTADEDGAKVTIEMPEVEADEAPAPAEDAATPVVVLQVSPEKADVKVNGQPVTLKAGNVKLTDFKLGDTIAVEAKATGYKDFKDKFVVKQKDVEIFELPMQRERTRAKATKAASAEPKATGKGTVSISATPWAKVFVDGRDMGLTPRKLELSAGRQTITLKKGSTTKTVTVQVLANKTVSRKVDMAQ